MLVILASDAGAGDCRELEACLDYRDTYVKKKKKIKTKSKETLCFCLRQGFFYAVLAGLDYIGQDRLELMKSTCFYLQVLG